MGKNYVFSGSKGVLAITEGVGKPIPVEGKGSEEIEAIIKRRTELGLELTKKLKEHGFVTASDEDTVVN